MHRPPTTEPPRVAPVAAPPRPRALNLRGTPHQREIAAIADRVRHTQESDLNYDREWERMTGGPVQASSDAAANWQTQRLIRRLLHDPGETQIGADWSNDVEVTLAQLLADGSVGTTARIVLGVLADDEGELDARGVTDAGAVAGAVVQLARTIGRRARVEVLRHRVTGDEAVVWLVEVELTLR